MRDEHPSCTEHAIELPAMPNTDKEEIRLLRQTLKDIRYIFSHYRKEHTDEAWETIDKLVNDPKLKTKGGHH